MSINMNDAQESAATKAPELNNRKILILYGSETGNSEYLAEDLGRLAERLHFQTWVCEMDDTGLKTLTQYPLAIFVTSTTGQGEFPKNARTLWRLLLRKKLLPTTFTNLRFTTFGLGDSSYSKFNVSARKLNKRLVQLGAVEFYAHGEGDERHDQGIDGTYLSWSFGLRKQLLSEYPLPRGLSPIPSDIQLPPKFTIELASIKNMFRPLGSTSQDTKAAVLSHVDTKDPDAFELDMYRERKDIGSYARKSESTAAKIPGGIHGLDRPNVIRDDVSKYSLQDTPSTEDVPPDDLLPIPGGWDAMLVTIDRVTPLDHWQDVRSLVLHVYPRPGVRGTGKKSKKPQKLEFLPGDVAVLFPKNFPQDVQALIDHMGWNEVADKPFVHYSHPNTGLVGEKTLTFAETPPKNCHPLWNTTLRQLLIHNYDITAIPTRNLFSHLKFFTEDPMARQKLSELSDPACDDEFNDYVPRPRRSILEILFDFPSVRVPYQWVPTIFPVIRGREYSIATGGPQKIIDDNAVDGSSSGLDSNSDLDDEDTGDATTKKTVKDKKDIGNHEDESKYVVRVELLVALIKYKTILRKTRQGLCSRYIESLKEGTRLRIGIKRHTGPPLGPEEGPMPPLQRPVLGIAAGTGVAPIRSFLWERFPYGIQTVLFLGFRKKKADFYFQQEWGPELDAKVFAAFSRDQLEKVYVQDLIRQESQLVCDLVNSRCIICLCGSSGAMPKAVRQALCDVTVQGGLFRNQAQAEAYLFKPDNFWEEVW